MRRATALTVSIRKLSSSTSIHSLLKSTPQPQIAKNTKTPILKVQGHSKSLMITPIKSCHCCLLW